MKDTTLASRSQVTRAAVGSILPRTGDALLNQPPSKPTDAHGTSIIAPPFIQAVGASASVQIGQRQVGLNENVEPIPSYPGSEVQNVHSLFSSHFGLTSSFILVPGRPSIPAIIEMTDLIPENLDLPQCES